MHGLAGDETAPDWPALTHADVEALLRGWPQLLPPYRIDWHSPRPLSAAALVATRTGAVFVKRHHVRVRSTATLRQEHRFMAHLRDRGVPVPEVLADAQGRTACARGDWVYEVHARAAGLDLYRQTMSWTPIDDLAHAHTAGVALAALHDASEGYDAPQRDTHILVARDELIRAADPVDALQRQLPERPGLAAYLAGHDWAADLRATIMPFHRGAHAHLASQPRLWTHNDWHVSNLCWSDANSGAAITAVLDFGLASPTFALFDLATAIERNAVAWLQLDGGQHAARIDVARALIDGYATRRPLAAAQLELLADLMPLVHVDFALSEVEYFASITGSSGHADVAYRTFLLGHAQWFETTPGQHLLRAIRTAGRP